MLKKSTFNSINKLNRNCIENLKFLSKKKKKQLLSELFKFLNVTNNNKSRISEIINSDKKFCKIIKSLLDFTKKLDHLDHFSISLKFNIVNNKSKKTNGSKKFNVYFYDIIGEGFFGQIHDIEVTNENNNIVYPLGEKIIKILFQYFQHNKKDPCAILKREIDISIIMSREKISPTVYAYATMDNMDEINSFFTKLDKSRINTPMCVGFIIMDKIHGKTLTHTPRLSPTNGRKLCKKYNRIHELGYIHNDLHPDNIMIDYQNGGEPYIIDFGLSLQIPKGKGVDVGKIIKEDYGLPVYWTSIKLNTMLAENPDIDPKSIKNQICVVPSKECERSFTTFLNITCDKYERNDEILESKNLIIDL